VPQTSLETCVQRIKAIPLLRKMTRTNSDLENRARKIMQELRLLQRMRLPARDKKAVARLKKETEEILRAVKDSREAVRLAERLQKKSTRTKRPRKR
jgi:hypothetical protein